MSDFGSLDLSSITDPSLFDPTSYDAGLSDGVVDFSGSSTLQDVTAGSGTLTLFTGSGALGDPTADQANVTINDPVTPNESQILSGITDAFFGPSAAASSPTPVAPAPSNATATLFSSLAKFGSGIAVLMAGQHTTTSAAVKQVGTGSAAKTNPLAIGSSQTVILLIIVAAAVLLLMRED